MRDIWLKVRRSLCWWEGELKTGMAFQHIPNPKPGTIDRVKWHRPSVDGVIRRTDWELARPLLVEIQWVGRVFARYTPEEVLKGQQIELPYWA